MKAITNEQIQQWLEAEQAIPLENQSPETEKEYYAYQQIFEGLKQKPEVNLSADFAAGVRFQVEIKRERKRDFSFAILLALFCVIAISGAVFVVGVENILMIADLLLTYKWFIIPGLLGFCGLHYLDQRLILRQGKWI